MRILKVLIRHTSSQLNPVLLATRLPAAGPGPIAVPWQYRTRMGRPTTRLAPCEPTDGPQVEEGDGLADLSFPF